MGLTSNSTTAVTQKAPSSVVQQPSQLWNSTLLEIVIGKSTQVSVTRIADIWAQRPNVTLLEKLNIKDSLEDVVLVEVEEEGERDKDAHLILGSHVIKGKGCRWPRVGGGVETESADSGSHVCQYEGTGVWRRNGCLDITVKKESEGGFYLESLLYYNCPLSRYAREKH